MFRFLQKSSLFKLISFNRISKLLTIARTTGSASLSFCFKFFSSIGYKIQFVSASAVTDLDSSNDGPLSPKISFSPNSHFDFWSVKNLSFSVIERRKKFCFRKYESCIEFVVLRCLTHSRQRMEIRNELRAAGTIVFFSSSSQKKKKKR